MAFMCAMRYSFESGIMELFDKLSSKLGKKCLPIEQDAGKLHDYSDAKL